MKLHAFAAAFVLTLPPTAALARLAACAGQTTTRPPAAAGVTVEKPGPVPANALGCTQGVAFQVAPDVTVWRCQAVPPDGQDLAEGAPEYGLLIARAGQPMQALPDELMAGRYGSFDVINADLDGDGAREVVLAAWNGQSNGMGVNRWTVRVFDRDWRLLKQFDDVADWGDASLVAAPPGRRGCDLAITSFVESVNRQGKPGISFEARFHRMRDGALTPADDRPTLRRRYDFTFQRDRTRHFERASSDEKGDVARWLSHRDARPAR